MFYKYYPGCSDKNTVLEEWGEGLKEGDELVGCCRNPGEREEWFGPMW